MPQFSSPSSRLVLLGATVLLTACGDSTGVETFPVTVRAQYPATYAQVAAAGATVVLLDAQRNRADTAVADASGTATFPRVLAGTYTVSASRVLSAAEALSLTGVSQGTNLAGTLAPQLISTTPGSPPVVALQGARLGDFVIKEVYFVGSKTAAGTNYFADQFVEIYNNSTDTLYADSLVIADVYGVSGQINPTNVPTEFRSDQNNVYIGTAWMIPGTGRQRPVAPGRSIVVAQDGINHRTDPNGNSLSPVDLSTADWETYNSASDRDADSPSVPNLVLQGPYRGGFDWNVPVFGPGIVIFRAPDPANLPQVFIPGSTTQQRTQVLNRYVIDGFEALQNSSSAPFKRIPVSIDAGFVYAGGTYTSESMRRKTLQTIGTRRVLQDTNNSTNDFSVVATPKVRDF